MSAPENLARWIISQSKGFTRKGIEKVIRPMEAYVCLLFHSQVQEWLSIVANSTSAGDAQEVFKIAFNALTNGDYSVGVDIERYQSVLEYALTQSKFFNRYRDLYPFK